MQTFISRADSPGQTATEYQALVIPRIGYKWYPFSAGLYVMPWLGVGLFPTVAGSSTVGGKAFKDMLLQPQPEIELGYEF